MDPFMKYPQCDCSRCYNRQLDNNERDERAHEEDKALCVLPAAECSFRRRPSDLLEILPKSLNYFNSPIVAHCCRLSQGALGSSSHPYLPPFSITFRSSMFLGGAPISPQYIRVICGSVMDIYFVIIVQSLH